MMGRQTHVFDKGSDLWGRGKIEGSSLLASDVDVGAVFQKQLDDFLLACPHRIMQRCFVDPIPHKHKKTQKKKRM